MCASTTASRRSTGARDWTNRTASQDRAFVDDDAHLLVVGQPVAQLVVEAILRALADGGDARADLVERAHELTLVARGIGAR